MRYGAAAFALDATMCHQWETMHKGGMRPGVFWHRYKKILGTLCNNTNLEKIFTNKGKWTDVKQYLYEEASNETEISKEFLKEGVVVCLAADIDKQIKQRHYRLMDAIYRRNTSQQWDLIAAAFEQGNIVFQKLVKQAHCRF